METTLTPRGPFSLKAAAEFGFGPTAERASFDGAMRLAFAVDGGTGYAGVVLRQPGPASTPASSRELYGTVLAEVECANGGDEAGAVAQAAVAQAAVAQAARIVSLDHDGEELLGVGARDPVIGALQREHPGQRPVLFHPPSRRRPGRSSRRVGRPPRRLRFEIGSPRRTGSGSSSPARRCTRSRSPTGLSGPRQYPRLIHGQQGIREPSRPRGSTHRRC
jgi:hypothetical protein